MILSNIGSFVQHHPPPPQYIMRPPGIERIIT